MSNQFERQRGGFLDKAVSARKRAKSFLDDVDQVIDWRPVEKFLKKKLRRNKDAVGNPSYPPLSMFKVLLLQRWYSLSDQAMDDHLTDRISFCRFAGLPVFHWTTTPLTAPASNVIKLTVVQWCLSSWKVLG